MTFDAVIFDEASQVKPENAIGALFRAKQFIITGDKEQLPPTNFFQNVDDDENSIEENYDTTAFDSILEVSSGIVNSIKLRWHYRSKFEELIRPSNKEIYRDLITFPSINKPEEHEGIQFLYVKGLYVDRKNEIEADKVIESLANIIEKYGTTKSVGVVTFNSEQQLLVERKINHFRRTHPHYEEFFTNNENEPFFVKNIETVQGDERDIIIISIGYGPDGKGKVSMNFGPLNQTNGYRRLNVAVTRAKTCLILVTSIRGTDIDLNRTQSRGAIFLKHYLEYAEFGEDEKVDTIDELIGFDSPFEEDVFNELTLLGHIVKKQIGCSGYRIDLAVVNPNNPSSYLLGIECDGATYHSSKSVRDRDRLRQQVLENRNWTIYRIWSTDWIKNKKTQVEKLDNFIKEIKPSEKNLLVDVQPNIPISTSKKEKSEIEFEQYPNYESLISRYNYNYFYENQIPGYILEIIRNTSPIHENELKKIEPHFWGRQKYTSVVDGFTRAILRSLSVRGEISLKGEYIIHKSTPISFRETKDTSTRRDFSNIYPEEIKDGILRVLDVAKTMNLDELYTLIVNLCGFQTVSSKIRDTLVNVISSLK
ncbi:MAG: AAA domain-containing protein, partial [Candidatus Izemoplasmatales bacterium]|nr:AAA domain-containing protein [Candidatus Izemoplasmatales bacterium]